MSTLVVHIWSDVACPWCWIGKRSLEKAIETFGSPVALNWRAFELNPNASPKAPEKVDYAQRLAEKYGTSVREARQFIDRMVEAGRTRGLEIRFDRIRPSSTFDAHRLLAWAREDDCQTDLKERLFRAYLNQGRSISDPGTLAELASESGLDGDHAVEILESNAYADEVRNDERLAMRLGINGVPCFVFGDTNLAVSGAQKPEVLADALRQASDRARQ